MKCPSFSRSNLIIGNRRRSNFHPGNSRRISLSLRWWNMNSPSDEMLAEFVASDETTTMEIDKSNVTEGEVEEEDDPFLKFVDYVKSVLCSREGVFNGDQMSSPSWSWITSRILITCAAYSSGVTPAILLSELSLAWTDQNRSGAPRKQSDFISTLKRHKRAKILNTITIDSIYEKKFLSLSSVIEAVIVDNFTLPGTDIHMLSLGDVWSTHTIDLYLHRRFYDIADPNYGILKKGREVILTGCYLRAAKGPSGGTRLLPTEHFVILLDEDDDNDAMLIGAQFCSDSFFSISLDAAKEGTSYSLYARIEHIGPLEVHGKNGGLQRKQITLVDNDSNRLKFVLWGEQVLVANVCSVGSMLALDKPYIASAMDSSNEICLECGSATQLYLVPAALHKEQVCVAFTQNPHQGSRLLAASNLSQGPMVSQVELPRDSYGSIDFSNYPFRSYVADLHDKMTGISLYGVVTDIRASKGMFSLKIEDGSGAIWTKLHFVGSWSLGRLGLGHTIFISGLSSSLTPDKSLELSWHEDSRGSSFFNLSCLPALFNSSCLHKLSSLSGLSISSGPNTKVCRVWVDQIEYCHVEIRFLHTVCGRLLGDPPSGDLECRFCDRCCHTEFERSFSLKITIADGTSKVVVRCIGQTAAELLQISPDEFAVLPEEEQIIYPASLEHEKFIVAIVNCRKHGLGLTSQRYHDDVINWEVTTAIKCL